MRAAVKTRGGMCDLDNIMIPDNIHNHVFEYHNGEIDGYKYVESLPNLKLEGRVVVIKSGNIAWGSTTTPDASDFFVGLQYSGASIESEIKYHETGSSYVVSVQASARNNYGTDQNLKMSIMGVKSDSTQEELTYWTDELPLGKWTPIELKFVASKAYSKFNVLFTNVSPANKDKTVFLDSFQVKTVGVPFDPNPCYSSDSECAVLDPKDGRTHIGGTGNGQLFGTDPWIGNQDSKSVGAWTQIDLGEDSSKHQIAGVLYRGSRADNINRIDFVTGVSVQISDDGVNFVSVPTRDDVKVYQDFHPIYNPSGGESAEFSQAYSIPNAVHLMYFYELRKARFIRFVVTGKSSGGFQMRAGLLIRPRDGDDVIPVPQGCPQRTCMFLASEPDNFYKRGFLFRGLSLRSLAQQQQVHGMIEDGNMITDNEYVVNVPGLYVVFELNVTPLAHITKCSSEKRESITYVNHSLTHSCHEVVKRETRKKNSLTSLAHIMRRYH